MRPPDLQNIVALLADCPIHWAVCGGWAIDLFLDSVNRPHKDVDVAIFRRDQHIAQDYLSQRGWQLDVVSQVQSTPWKAGEAIQLPRHIIFCKHPDFVPDFLELLFNEASDTHFLFRRNPKIKRKLEHTFIISASGVPILAPEIALLYKSNAVDMNGNAADFRNALPHMSAAQLNWLAQALHIQYGQHDWLTLIERQNDTL